MQCFHWASEGWTPMYSAAGRDWAGGSGGMVVVAASFQALLDNACPQGHSAPPCATPPACHPPAQPCPGCPAPAAGSSVCCQAATAHDRWKGQMEGGWVGFRLGGWVGVRRVGCVTGHQDDLRCANCANQTTAAPPHPPTCSSISSRSTAAATTKAYISRTEPILV